MPDPIVNTTSNSKKGQRKLVQRHGKTLILATLAFLVFTALVIKPILAAPTAAALAVLALRR